MAIVSLNETYSANKLSYMCNACGDINKPGADPLDFRVYQPEDVMTPEEQTLYESYWNEGSGCCEYVLRIGESAAMGLGFLLDTGWCRDLLEELSNGGIEDSDIENLWMPKLFLAAKEASENVIQPLVAGCDIHIGEWTDPDGHEILVIVPYRLRDELSDIVKNLCDSVYSSVENAFYRLTGLK